MQQILQILKEVKKEVDNEIRLENYQKIESNLKSNNFFKISSQKANEQFDKFLP